MSQKGSDIITNRKFASIQLFYITEASISLFFSPSSLNIGDTGIRNNKKYGKILVEMVGQVGNSYTKREMHVL